MSDNNCYATIFLLPDPAMISAIDTTEKFPLKKRFSQILNAEIGDGDAADDTVKTYTQQFKLFVNWCDRCGITLETATSADIKDYRRYLVNKGLKRTTIALKLTVVRRIYAIALERGLITINPAAHIRPPKRRQEPIENENYLESVEAQKLIDTLPVENTLKGLRDRLLVILMVVQGCRQIGLYNLNFGDIVRRRGKVALEIRAKGSIRKLPLTDEVAAILDKYLAARKASGENLKQDTPIFVSLAKNSSPTAHENRLSRRSMQRIANAYLEAASLKHSENRTVTTHGLRHTVGYLLTLAGKPLRVIQKFLGHSDPKTTAIYAHVASLWEDNPAISLGLSV